MTAGPGPALLRQNVGWLRTATNPTAAEIRRLAHDEASALLALFDLGSMPAAVAAVRALCAVGKQSVAVRGRVVPDEAVAVFERLWLGDRLFDLLEVLGQPLPTRWTHPVLFADAWRAGGGAERLGVVWSRLPEPGVLDLADVGRAEVREGACAAALPIDVGSDELRGLLDAFGAAHAERVLLVDAGGDAASLAEALCERGRLGGYFAPAHRAVPAAVKHAGAPVYTWFEPEDRALDELAELPAACRGCAYVPVGLAGEGIPEATARLLELRALGYSALVPRFFLPVPSTREWQRLVAEHGLRDEPERCLDGSRPVFAMPDYDRVAGPDVVALWTDRNRWPDAPPTVRAPAAYSLGSVHAVLTGYLRDARRSIPDSHARDLIAALLAELGCGGADLTPLAAYPFLAWRGRSLTALLDEAVERRLRASDGVPEALLDAIRHTALAGGKRLRPVLALAVACAHGAPLDAALRAALALEWLHTASLMQDDLPCMDDDAVRRRSASAHVRHGEGLALLASDALVAMAFQDLAGLAEHPAVGPARAVEMLAAVAAAIGPSGLSGGQARDLLLRESDELDLRELLEIHRQKTAPLFRLAATLGAILGSADAARRRRLEDCLGDLGLAFQVIDDLLDARGGDEFGRPPGSDARQRRATFATAMERERALRFATELTAPIATLVAAAPELSTLVKLARFAVERRG